MKSETELRRKLFIIERQLSRREAEKPKSLAERVLSKTEPVVPDRIEPTADTDTAGAEGPASGTANMKSEPGSVNFGFEGGKLTSFNYSSTGLDLSGAADFGLKVMLRSDSVDLDSLQKDGNMNDAFASSNRESFYGLKNFEKFKDMFAEETKTKDYSVLGMGFTYETGGLTVGMLNYSKPPTRKKVEFFGNNSVGPYKINAVNIIPGSEIVRVDGTELARGSGYTISYSKGEVTFTGPVASGGRVLIEYELAESGSGGEPGRFTGFRIQTPSKKSDSEPQPNQSKPKTGTDAGNTPAVQPDDDQDQGGPGQFKFGPVSFDKWGVTYLTDDLITYKSNGDEITRSELSHQLMGFDGAVSLWKNTEVQFEAAQSTGNKQREMGRYAKATFTIADSHASDGNPLGPYQLDETKLPVIEDSDELRLNGELLKRDEDYTLDNEYGTLRLKKKDLNLSSLDSFEIAYRYLTEEDRLSGDAQAQQDIAGAVTMKNTFGGFSHTYSVERRGADFMLVGGKTDNQLKNEKQDIAWKSKKGLSLNIGRITSDSLMDRNSGLSKTDQGQTFTTTYTKGAISFGYAKNKKEQFDNQTVRDTDSTKTDSAVNASYAFSKKYKIAFNQKQNTGSDLRSGNTSETYSRERGYKLDAEPIKKANVMLGLGEGETRNTSAATTRKSSKESKNGSLKYRASKKIQLSFDMSANSYSNDEAAVSTQAARTASDTAETGNSDMKWTAQYQPSKETTLMVRSTDSRQNQANGTSEKTQNMIDLRQKLSASTDLQIQYTAMDSDRPNQTQSTDVRSASVRTKTKWFDGMEITLKHEEQKSRIDQIVSSATRTDSGTSADQVTVKCAPFWEKRNVSVEYQMKAGDQQSSGQSPTNDRETRLKTEIEIPFIKDSYFAVSREKSDVTGGRQTSQETKEISLNGNPVKGMSIQLSYRSEGFTDALAPQSARKQSSLNIVVKSDWKW